MSKKCRPIPEPLPVVEIARSTYQPSKAELEEPIEFPEDTTTVEQLVQAVVRPVKVHYVRASKHRG